VDAYNIYKRFDLFSSLFLGTALSSPSGLSSLLGRPDLCFFILKPIVSGLFVSVKLFITFLSTACFFILQTHYIRSLLHCQAFSYFSLLGTRLWHLPYIYCLLPYPTKPLLHTFCYLSTLFRLYLLIKFN